MKPLLQVIFDALEERGWTSEDGVYVDPEGNKWFDLCDAISAQTFREIAAAGPPATASEE